MDIAVVFGGEEVLPSAAGLTLLLFAGLTAVVFTTRQDFSCLRGFLTMGGFVTLGLILFSTLFSFSLGLIFSGAMVIFASAAILYETSKVMKHDVTDQDVAAALELLASVALLFWYVLPIVMAMRR